MATKSKDEEALIGADQPATLLNVGELIRGVLGIFEAAQPNSAQREAITQVRVLLGDTPAPGCAHDQGEHRTAEDDLICDKCGDVLEKAPENAGVASHNETASSVK